MGRAGMGCEQCDREVFAESLGCTYCKCVIPARCCWFLCFNERNVGRRRSNIEYGCCIIATWMPRDVPGVVYLGGKQTP